MNQADITHLISKLRIKIAPRHRNFKQPQGPEGRLNNLRKVVNALLKYERLELPYPRADEVRGYAERVSFYHLISIISKHPILINVNFR